MFIATTSFALLGLASFTLVGSSPAAQYQKLDSRQVLDLPYQRCDTHNGKCEKRSTGFILDVGGNYTRISDAKIEKTFNGIKFNTPGPVVRGYLFDKDVNEYEIFRLKNRQFSFDVNIASVRCGYNAALFFSQMDVEDKPGTGYCDGQNVCNEMDIFEGNAAASAAVLHPCNATDKTGKCDPWGCGVNTNTHIPTLVGPKRHIDTQKTYTVTTQFFTSNNKVNGELVAVKQFASQGKKTVALPTLSIDYCNQQEAGNPYWNVTGEFPGISRSWDIGQVLIFAFWGSGGDSMSWLDGGLANPRCNQTLGKSATGEVTFANIKVDFIRKITVSA
ncbi:hypothetical protein HK097_008158 [Rhizophlyctis rosea]|uniref:cellulase n=1 Tax=Rhizophlyctis rosea TaxID=64517 RepID=A0AAD5SDC7_9FUNG|nr:hypothetical protein HK097_008158 [Rhizophlyctis rosea]